ncbi:MAG: hypothetical protein WCI93_00240 [bacterium]
MFTLKNILILIGRNAIISIIVIAICLSGILFFSKEITKMSDSAASSNNLDFGAKKAANVLEVFNYDTQIVGTNYEKIAGAFAPADNILGFIGELDSLTSKTASKQIYRFNTPTEPIITSPFPIATVSYADTFSTNVSDFSNYLKKFEQLPYFTDMEGFDITSQDKAGWTGMSSVSFQAKLYVKIVQ